MTRRRLATIALAIALLVIGRWVATWDRERRDAERTAERETAIPLDAALPPHAPPLRRPPAAAAELVVLTSRDPTELAQDREALAAAMTERQCGDPAACDAVRRVVRDEHATTLRVERPEEALGDGGPLAAALEGLRQDAGAHRDAGTPPSYAVVVHVATTPDRNALALRASFAAAAVLAAREGALVADPLLGRVENAADFGSHAVTEPLGASVFRGDRIALRVEPAAGAGEDVVRMVTAGLARWGAPDVEAAAVPAAAADAMGDIVLRVAEALADGAEHGPIDLARRASVSPDGGPLVLADDAGDAGDADAGSVRVALASVTALPDDPNDFLARIEPAGGEGPMAYLDMAEEIFGPGLLARDERSQRAPQSRATRTLDDALATWTPGTELRVRFAFPIPGGGGTEDIWVAVTRFDARTVTGRILDEPLAATDVARGDVVTRDRADAKDVRTRTRAQPSAEAGVDAGGER